LGASTRAYTRYLIVSKSQVFNKLLRTLLCLYLRFSLIYQLTIPDTGPESTGLGCGLKRDALPSGGPIDPGRESGTARHRIHVRNQYTHS
jgi:hypothetical protein